MQGTHLNFRTKDMAIQFAQKQGWPFYVDSIKRQAFRAKRYANNVRLMPTCVPSRLCSLGDNGVRAQFLHHPHEAGKLRIVKTK